jgi:predicted metal-dependent hydrolase
MYPPAYIDFLVHFHGDRDYFECHEILEEYWKQSAPTERSKVWVGFIQVAVSLYHHRRENFEGAEKMMRSALKIFNDHTKELHSLGIEWRMMLEKLEERLKEIQSRTPYSSIMLPIGDPILYKQCKQRCMEKSWTWGAPSVMENEELIHRHTRRDRSEVIEERVKQLYIRSENRNKS